jgi:hypothetical protein
LANLDKVLTMCAEVDFVLNWEKCHFMVKQGIVLGHEHGVLTLVISLWLYRKLSNQTWCL